MAGHAIINKCNCISLQTFKICISFFLADVWLLQDTTKAKAQSGNTQWRTVQRFDALHLARESTTKEYKEQTTRIARLLHWEHFTTAAIFSTWRTVCSFYQATPAPFSEFGYGKIKACSSALCSDRVQLIEFFYDHKFALSSCFSCRFKSPIQQKAKHVWPRSPWTWLGGHI
jgi:hypothetical protein